jgi:chromosome segregation ATPase
MSDEEKKEPQENQNPGGAPESNAAPTEAELEAIKAELEEERKAKAAAEAALAEKDSTIAGIQGQLDGLRVSISEANTELAQVKEAHGQAVAKYLEAVKTANPTIPADVIAGSSIEEIDASLARATTIAGAVKANLEAQAKEAKVPAGAPPRTEINLEGLSPREKIAAGIQQKGGTSQT